MGKAQIQARSSALLPVAGWITAPLLHVLTRLRSLTDPVDDLETPEVFLEVDASCGVSLQLKPQGFAAHSPQQGVVLLKEISEHQ